VSIRITVNGQEREFAGDGDMPLLWYLRDHAGLTGTKFGCGGGFCGACTVLIDGAAQRSCLLPVSTLAGRRITTIEGLGASGLHPVQKAWIEEDVAQCGYCQAGQVLAAVALLERIPDPAPADVDTITNLCRCGTYVRIRRAIARAAREMKDAK
jgi:isoquinoline 1-oxidoreductase alpha subunit